jgi:hypothetical protein
MKLHEDGEAVKQIFDHFRNLGIAGVTLGATRFTVEGAQTGNLLVQVTLSISTAILVVLAFSLLYLNYRHGLELLHKRHPAHTNTSIVLTALYALIFLSLFAAIARESWKP